MKGFFLTVLMLLSFVASSQKFEPVDFKYEYASMIDKKDKESFKEKIFYPTKTTVDIKEYKITFRYTDDGYPAELKCRIFDFEVKEDHTDIHTVSDIGKSVLFRIYNEYIFIVFTDTVIVLSN